MNTQQSAPNCCTDASCKTKQIHKVLGTQYVCSHQACGLATIEEFRQKSNAVKNAVRNYARETSIQEKKFAGLVIELTKIKNLPTELKQPLYNSLYLVNLVENAQETMQHAKLKGYVCIVWIEEQVNDLLALIETQEPIHDSRTEETARQEEIIESNNKLQSLQTKMNEQQTQLEILKEEVADLERQQSAINREAKETNKQYQEAFAFHESLIAQPEVTLTTQQTNPEGFICNIQSANNYANMPSACPTRGPINPTSAPLEETSQGNTSEFIWDWD